MTLLADRNGATPARKRKHDINSIKPVKRYAWDVRFSEWVDRRRYQRCETFGALNTAPKKASARPTN